MFQRPARFISHFFAKVGVFFRNIFKRVFSIKKRSRLDRKSLIPYGVIPFFVSLIVTSLVLFVFMPCNGLCVSLPAFNVSRISWLPQLANAQNRPMDPFVLTQHIKNNSDSIFVVDIRSKGEYEKGHIRRAVNIPFYNSTDSVDKDIEVTLPEEFKKQADDKMLVVYSYSQYSPHTEEAVSWFKSKGYTVVPLAIGWNEFMHFKNFWVPDSQWDSFTIESFVDKPIREE